MDTDPPIKEEDPDFDMSFQFSNLPDNPIMLDSDDDFGSDDDIRELSPPPDTDTDDSDDEYEPPLMRDGPQLPAIIVVRDSTTPGPHVGAQRPAPRHIPEEDQAPGTPSGSDSEPEDDPDNARLSEGMRIRQQMYSLDPLGWLLIHRRVAQLTGRHFEHKELRLTTIPLPHIPLRPKYALKPWQELGVRFLDRSRKKSNVALLGDEMGVGKVVTPTLWHDDINVRQSRPYALCGSEFIKLSSSRTAVFPQNPESLV